MQQNKLLFFADLVALTMFTLTTVANVKYLFNSLLSPRLQAVHIEITQLLFVAFFESKCTYQHTNEFIKFVSCMH